MISSNPYDVIIVGGRPAGASLAARLGHRGLRVLIVDRASFPSQPAVPSCPILYAAAIRLLDEIGVPEPSYLHATTRVEVGAIEFDGYFKTVFKFPEVYGRRYVYGIDRALLDDVVWKHLASCPTVTTREGFAVTDLMRDRAGRVVGIQGSNKESAPEVMRANLCVVGADGRYSFVARKVEAKIVEDVNRTSTVHYAEWENVAPVTPDGAASVHIVGSGRGKNVLFFPSIQGRISIATHARSDRVDLGGDVNKYYLDYIHSFQSARKRIHGARQIGPLLGIKRVANRYMQHAGPGWVLVGDALHHKDPVDGQGIYDALIEAKRLAEILATVHEGKRPWQAAMDAYHQAVLRETHGMFNVSMKRLEKELYSEPSALMIRTFLRWLISDPDYQRRFFLFLGRAIPPENWLPPSMVLQAIIRGATGDLASLLHQAMDLGRALVRTSAEAGPS